MALQDTYAVPPHSLPTPADSPVENNGSGITRKPSHHGSISRFSNRGSIHFSRDSQSFFPRHSFDQDGGFVEKRSSIDSRRFTSDLDHSLLQQIHLLRSELESKSKIVDSLEDGLQQSREENATLLQEAAKHNAESRSLKKQMQVLEDSTLTALDDLAKERDAAVGSMSELRHRLDVANKKLRAQEEHTENMHSSKEDEQQKWANEKSLMERKIHVLEARLKTMVTEMVAAESAAPVRPGTGSSESDAIPWASRTDNVSIRSSSRAESRMSNRSFGEARDSRDFRAPSRLSALQEVGESGSSLNLADELEREQSGSDEEEYAMDPELISPAALPEEINPRKGRYSEDAKARKVMGLPIEYMNVTKPSDDLHENGTAQESISDEGQVRTMMYTDAGTQSSAPPSPAGLLQRPTSTATDASVQTEQTSDHALEGKPKPLLVSTQTQTDLAPIIPPTAGVPDPNIAQSPPAVETSDNGCQTESQHGKWFLPWKRGTFSSDEIPTIAIHPPGSRPTSSHTSVMLPPRTRNASTLCNIEVPRDLQSVSTQTSDHFRLFQLPPRNSSSTSVGRLHERRQQAVPTIPPKASRRKLKSPPPILQNDPPPESPPISTIRNIYPGKNDDGPVNDKYQFGPRRPIRSGSILAGFSDDNDYVSHDHEETMSEDEFVAAPPIRKTLSKVKDSWRLVPQSHQTELDRIESMSDTEAQAESGYFEATAKPASKPSLDNGPSMKDTQPNTSKKMVTKQNMRRAALVSSGSNAHAQRQRSPSLPSVSTASTGPPLPVPTRSSSRKLPLSASDGAGSPSPYTTSFFTTRRDRQQARPASKRKPLRKTQSAAAVHEPSISSQPVPSLPRSSDIRGPRTPISTRNSRTTSRTDSRTHYSRHDANGPDRSEPMSPKSTTNADSPESQGSDVIHAVTQTMIGEWMFKYVRKRKSFGKTENAQNEFERGSVGATRHKRWVWVLPRERAVVWSEKEPTTAVAIGGKGGRKLTIQSVVDVPDTTPFPKGYNADQIFNRSILILTPERALKLTAVSRERHYIWLTALSYISSSDFNLTLIEGPVSPQHTPTRDSTYLQKPTEHRMSEDAAEPPQVPRGPVRPTHGRKRSATGPSSKPLLNNSLHSYSANVIGTASSHDLHHSSFATANPQPSYSRPMQTNSGPATAAPSMTTHSTRVHGANDSVSHIVPNNVFDAIGTVRMEAFVEDEFGLPRDHPAIGGGLGARTRKRAESRGKRKDLAYWGVGEDPFRGF